MSEFGVGDYIKMQNQIYISGVSGAQNVEVIVYGEDKPIKLHVWFDKCDQTIIDRCKMHLFVKAYQDNRTGRDGVNTQTSNTIRFDEFGYGVNSTVSLRRLIAMNCTGWTLQFMEDNGLDIFPSNDNHLDLRRENLVVGRVSLYYGEDVRTEIPLLNAKDKFNESNN